jgi:hypothetical protein
VSGHAAQGVLGAPDIERIGENGWHDETRVKPLPKRDHMRFPNG